ncbi:UDP-2,4-diacetamido-2,4,6-trideoxy-beta-L-altropyranose hydrolase [Castellaniella ginsengisoli]|uniref:UDP-2,4-diacetamido-2,4, 6-trideoxy-beta-L-altropyranose hydrolase n=1 Tax=Castellaniella ginsengisoli TaxID=546114 RepID=A0AB39EV46_9BURK
MKILIRVDSSVDIGSGHIMRCMTLAEQLSAQGAEVCFICRDLQGSLVNVLIKQGYSCIRFQTEAYSVDIDVDATLSAIQDSFMGRIDWLIVDHYGLDAEWEMRIRPFVGNILVIDDLANRPHDCDLLLDQNFYIDMEARYAGLVSEKTKCLLGPAYVLLRPEFYEARKALRYRSGVVKRVLVFFGGSDPANQTRCVLDSIDDLQLADVRVDVVVGSANPHRRDIKEFCNSRKWAQYYCQVSNMAELILSADLGIGAGGTAMWERCVLGLPTLTITFAENQIKTTKDVAQIGAISYLGWFEDLTVTDYACAISDLLNRPSYLARMSDRALGLIDTSGRGCDFIIRAMKRFTHTRVIR